MTLLADIGRFLIMLKGMFKKLENRQMYWKELMRQCTEIGFGSLGIVTIISVFIGAVSTIQTAYQLVSPLIPISTIAQIVRDTVILEFAPTLVCVVLAGVAGSRIASELGNMRVSEQIDALEIMGINTKTYLILPKIVAAMLMIPLLVIIAMALGYVRLSTIQCVFCIDKILCIFFYPIKYPCFLRILCARRCVRDRESKYQSGCSKLCINSFCRLYSFCPFALTA